MDRSKHDKKVFITGGAGYIGSIMVRRLLQEGYQVICADILNFGGGSLLGIWDHPRFELKKVDIMDHAAINALLREESPFAVVHLAAIVGDPACRMEPELATNTNRDASNNLLEAAMNCGVERFIFASTCSNYGKMKEAGGFVNEDSELRPVSLYAELKVEFEDRLLNQIEKRDDFCPTALRFATVYGISPRMRFDLTVNEFTKELALGRELLVFGNQFWRPYCHVSDFSNAMMTVLHAPKEKVAYNVFNVGDTNENYTKQMIVDAILEQIPEGRVSYVQKDEDPRDYRVNFDKIRDTLGFKISKTVPEGIADILRGIRSGVIENADHQRHYNIPINS